MDTVLRDPDGLETWENISDSTFVIRKVMASGQIGEEPIVGRRKFHLSTRERKMNQELAAELSLDPFHNGMFSPVRLIDSTSDAEEIATNPNLLGESDMAELVKGSAKKLAARVAEIENPLVVARLLEVAQESDVQASKIATIEGRLAELNPPAEGGLDPTAKDRGE